MKKKRGSTVLTVLAVTMVLMLLGGILLNVIMGTTKGNEDSNKRQDLKYGAEGGLEIARSYLAKNGYKEMDNATIETKINEKAEMLTEAKTPESNVTKMEIKLNPVKKETKLTGVEIVSKAIYSENGENKEEKAKCKVISGHNGNFMDHGLVGGEGGVQMNDNASANLESTSVSTGIGGIKYPTANGSHVEKPKPENEHENSFRQLKFKTEGRVSEINSEIIHEGNLIFKEDIKIDNVKIKIETVNGKTTSSIEGSTDNAITYVGSLKAPVIKLEIIDGASGEIVGVNPKIYIINSEKFNVEFSGSVGVDNTIIINSGNMKIEGNGSINMINSTFIANKIESGMNVGFTVTGQPNKIDNNTWGIFSKEEEEELNKILNVLIPNWAENNTGGSEYVTVEDGSYE